MTDDQQTAARPLRYLEIGFRPLLKNAFPARTEFIDTRFRWADVRTYEVQEQSIIRRLAGKMVLFFKALRIGTYQNYDVVVTRCLGPVNSFGQSWLAHLGRVFMGGLFRCLVFYAARGKRVRLAVIDQTDHVTIHPRDRRLVWACDVYFKRELADNHWHTLEAVLPRGACIGAMPKAEIGAKLRSKLRPFALGIESTAILPPILSAEKMHDLFYCGFSGEIPVRQHLGEVLAKLGERGWKVYAPEQRLTPDEFRRAVRQSRFCLSPGGSGWDCYRHYEVAAYGSVPLFNYRSIWTIAPFRHGEHCFYYDPQGDLIEQFETWLKLPPMTLDQITAAAQAHLNSHFTFDALAHYVIQEIERLPHG
jgi:hypothetical protein